MNAGIIETQSCDGQTEQTLEMFLETINNGNFIQDVMNFIGRQSQLDQHQLSGFLNRPQVTTKHKLAFLQNAVEKNDKTLLNHLLAVYTTQDVNNISQHYLQNYYVYNSEAYKKCYKILYERRENDIDVNLKDNFGNYPLHYATKYNDSELILHLLKNRASLANKNNLGVLTIAGINYKILKDHFDSCIESRGETYLQDPEIFFVYKTLIPISSAKSNIGTEEEPLRRKSLEYQMGAILFISKSNELKSLLNHPLIKNFLQIKNDQFKIIYALNSYIYSMFTLFTTSYVIFWWAGINIFTIPLAIVFILSAIIVTLLVCRECFQFCILGKAYFKMFENYIEVIQITIVFYMFYNMYAHFNTKLYILIFIASANLMACINRIFMSGKKIDMLFAICINCLQVLGIFSFLLYFFVLTFTTLFKDYPSSNENITNTSMCTEDQPNLFNHPILAFTRVIIMLTGEFEIDGLNFDRNPYIGPIVLLVFVVFFAIPFMNMLNGLAVVDIQRIESEAILHSLSITVLYLSRVELIILGISSYDYLTIFYLILSTIVKDVFKINIFILSNKLKEDAIEVVDDTIKIKAMEILRNNKFKQIKINKQERIYHLLGDILDKLENIEQRVNS